VAAQTNHQPIEKHQQPADAGVLTRDRALALVLVVATALVAYVCYRLVQPFLPAVAWALALAVVTHPVHGWLARHIKNANLAALAAVALVTLVLLVPAGFVLDALLQEAAVNADRVQDQLEAGRWRHAIERNPSLAPLLGWLERNVNVDQELRRIVPALTSDVTAFVTGSVQAVAQFLITLFLLFYFFRDRRQALGAIRSLVPLSDVETAALFARVRDTVYGTVFGTLFVAAVQGALGGLMFWWLGLPAPVLWGAVMAVLAVIPWLGAFVVWAPAAVFLALEGSWGSALLLTAWGVLVVGLIDNLLYPIVVGKRLRLHTAVVFVAILGGLAVFGASGVILGPVAVAVMGALVEVWRVRTAAGRAADVPGATRDIIRV
jgi:predicted PurR-regulated permease PerM